jgi:hypothetical protein
MGLSSMPPAMPVPILAGKARQDMELDTTREGASLVGQSDREGGPPRFPLSVWYGSDPPSCGKELV